MIRPIAFANAIAVMTAGLALFLMVLRLLVPQFFVFFFTPSFSGGCCLTPPTPPGGRQLEHQPF